MIHCSGNGEYKLNHQALTCKQNTRHLTMKTKLGHHYLEVHVHIGFMEDISCK